MPALAGRDPDGVQRGPKGRAGRPRRRAARRPRGSRRATFVGPAGRLLDEALEEAGIERRDAYLTNAVKHFKWTPRGTRRIHQRPNANEVAACRPWLEGELQVVKPSVLVCLGAVAAQTLLGRSARVTRDRGRPFETEVAAVAFATVHPSSILRAPDATSRKRERAQFVDDLRVAAAALANAGA